MITVEHRRIALAHLAAEWNRIKRAKEKRHRAKIHASIVSALTDPRIGGISEQAAIRIVAALAKGIPNVNISY